MAMQDFDHTAPEVILSFYRHLYPFKSVFKWLNHEHTPSRLFTHREIAFSLRGDIYIRYNSFLNADEFKNQTLKYNPERFEIGPVYSARPRDKKTVRPAMFTPQLRELVFDIDMTDYDSIRTCCSGASVCKRCWAFISAAVRVLDAALRDQFGYRHLLWVYSGRRGIHCWVSDDEAMELTDEQRRAVAQYLTVVQGGKEMHKKVNVRPPGRQSGRPWPLPPAVRDALDILTEVFVDLILHDQNLFERDEQWEELLKLIPDPDIAGSLRRAWNMDENLPSEEKWSQIKGKTKDLEKGSPERDTMMAALEDIVLQYTYPRIDAEVSKHRNHLLKAPFCVHPKTGRVCVPVDPTHIDDFDPENVPTVSQLMQELEAGKLQESGEEQGDWERTSLKPYIDMFEAHIINIMNEVRIAKRATDTSW
ncbi:prim-pol domain-containing protein [Vararia minispora EC-137]|uniref:Prim-pol domain-containing protein n=1 Tax=Vararia minispora EC-137 TaxID=1314806 RepID=A0ACB8QTH4_9AGAM|nr:prim-pol domain-containing protein [Vararia minispora EC-137]